MFRLFKRKNIESWETSLLLKVLTELPTEYYYLISQIKDGLLKGVIVNASDIEGYIAFTYNQNYVYKYEKKNEQSFRINHIKIFDIIGAKFLNYTIYVSYGMISGYSIQGAKKYKIDINKIDTSNLEITYNKNPDFDKLSKILNKDDLEIINPSDVYIINIDNQNYFHVFDLEDGDFVGVDMKKIFL